MKKTFRMVGLVLMAVMMACSFAACGSDDDDDDDPNFSGERDSALVGKWTSGRQDEGDGEWWEDTIEFKKNGKWRSEENGWDSDEGKYKDWSEGTWYTSNGYIYIEITKSSDRDDIGETDHSRYTVGNGWIEIDGERFTKK